MKYYILLFAFLAFLPASLRAQQYNCSVTTFTQVTAATSDKSHCPYTLTYITYTTTWGINAYCVNTQTNASYNLTPVTLTAEGYCAPNALGGPLIDCQPSYTWNKVTPTYAGSVNQLNLIGQNGEFLAAGCTKVTGATINYQCPTQACAASGGNHTCGKGGSGPCTSSPIIFDVSGNGYFLTDASHGVSFDISGSGTPIQMGWTSPGANNAFLALPGPDGLVTNGEQLFGNFSPQPPCPTSDTTCTMNGFRALAVYDDPNNGGNGDGIIDARDGIFSSLRLWIDANHDGISQPNELYTLPALGINSISLSYKASQKTDQFGNVFEYRAQLNPNNPTDAGKTAYDVFFVTQAPTAQLVLPPVTMAQVRSCPNPAASSPSHGIGFTVTSVKH